VTISDVHGCEWRGGIRTTWIRFLEGNRSRRNGVWMSLRERRHVTTRIDPTFKMVRTTDAGVGSRLANAVVRGIGKARRIDWPARTKS